MALLTLIARASDGLPLSASVLDDEAGRNLAEFQTQAKQIFRKLSPQSPRRCSIESPPLVFHYIISDDICYMALCEPTYPPTLAFSYLENVNTEFIGQYSQEIHKAHRPYYFIEFGAELNRIKKNYQDVSGSRKATHLKGLSDELQGVQKIMFENIDAVLQRGELISALSDKASHLAVHSRAYRQEAKLLNIRASLAAKIAIVVVVFFLLLLLRYLLF